MSQKQKIRELAERSLAKRQSSRKRSFPSIVVVKRRLVRRSGNDDASDDDASDSKAASDDASSAEEEKSFVAGDDERIDSFFAAGDRFTEPGQEDEFKAWRLEREADIRREALDTRRATYALKGTTAAMQDKVVGIEEALADFLSIDNHSDAFLEKFDAVLLNETFVQFCARINRRTVSAALAHAAWRCVELERSRAGRCFLCGKRRHANSHRLVTSQFVAVGYVGEFCATRWQLLERIYALRTRIVASVGCANSTDIFAAEMGQLREECTRELQRVDQTWNRDADVEDD